MRATTRILVVAALAVTAARASATTAPLVGDAHTSSQSPATKYGTNVNLEVVGPPASATAKNTYIQFDLSQLPAGTTGAEVAKATLLLFTGAVTTPGSLDVVRVTSAWTEADLTADTAPTLGATEVNALGVDLTDRNDYKAVDITAAVQDWLNGVLPNNGLALVANGVDGLNAKFASKENTGKAHNALLDITLTGGAIGGNINLNASTATVGNILKDGVPFIHDFGVWNTFLGVDAGNLAMSGNANTGVGELALNLNTSGSANVALGRSALTSNTEGSGNAAVGNEALFSNTTGGGNTAVGTGALVLNQTGSFNTGIGAAAISGCIDGSQNTAVGAGALNLTNGWSNTAVGYGALQNNQESSGNTAVGDSALYSNTTGNANVAIGESALLSNQTGIGNTGLGAAALFSNSGSFNTAIGRSALYANTTGIENVAVGANSLRFNTSGTQNVALGSGALAANTTGGTNVAVGTGALDSNTTGSSSTAVGAAALSSNDTGTDNTAVGGLALSANTSGDGNTGVGRAALNANTTGFGNTAVGYAALLTNATGFSNTAVGDFALLSNSTGQGNVALGRDAGWVATGDNNILIANAGVAGQSGTIRIGTAGTHNGPTFIRGIWGTTVNFASGQQVFVDSSGQLGTFLSSQRYKDDIRDMAGVSSTLMQLRPVTFHYKAELDPSGTPQYGLIAEEVAAVMPDLVVYGADGRPETVRYHLLEPLLLNELQRQSRRIDAQAREIAQLRARARKVDDLETRLAALEASLTAMGPQQVAARSKFAAE